MNHARVLLIGVLLCAVGVPARAGANDALADSLYRAPSQFDFASNPGLLDRLLASPYAYFRFTNLPFARAVCERFEDTLPVLPFVNLHGDPHLEQYAITNEGYGLSDFDDACTGPSVIDLVRFCASIVIACDRRGWTDEQPWLLRRFLDGYQTALLDPRAQAAVPVHVQRVLDDFGTNRSPFLEWVESILEPIDPIEAEPLFAGFERYRTMVHERNGRLNAGFFDVIRAGRVRIGVGSALDRKYLLRVAGPTDATQDDVVLEVRAVRDLRGIPCVRGGEGTGALRILLGYSRIGSVPLDYIGPLPRSDESEPDEAEYWVHAWQAFYRELDVEHDAFSVEELGEMVFDAGLKLGHGHVREIADPHEVTLRRMELSAVRRLEAPILAAALDLAAATQRAWERFVAESGGR